MTLLPPYPLTPYTLTPLLPYTRLCLHVSSLNWWSGGIRKTQVLNTKSHISCLMPKKLGEARNTIDEEAMQNIADVFMEKAQIKIGEEFDTARFVKWGEEGGAGGAFSRATAYRYLNYMVRMGIMVAVSPGKACFIPVEEM